MILKGISVNQNPPTKDYLWITPKGNARFWDQSTWRLIGGSGGGGSGDINWDSLITYDGNNNHIINLNYLPISLNSNTITIGTNSISVIPTSRTISTTNGLSGGGNLSQDRTIGIESNYKNALDSLISMFEIDSNGDIKTKDYIENGVTKHRGFYSESFISALGLNSSGGGGGGDINWANLTTWDEDPEHIINENYLPYNLEYVTSHPYYAIEADANGKLYVNVNWHDTTYSAGTGLSLNGTTFNHTNAITSGNFGLSSNTEANNISLPYISYDSQGHITGTPTSHTFTIGDLNAATVFRSGTKIPFGNLPNLYIGYTQVSDVQSTGIQLRGISKITSKSTNNDTSTAAIEWDSTNNAWHFYGGIYSDSFVSALGAGSGGGGGGGINVVDLWNELTNATGSDPSYQNTQIAVAHIPTLSITDKTSGTLPITRGGTGRTTTASGAWYNTAANQTSPTIGTLPIAQGGTGNTTGTAEYSRVLKNYYTYNTRPTSADFTHVSDGGIVHFKATSSMSTNYPGVDGHILHFNWDNSAAWDAQLFIPDSHSASMKWRAQNSGPTWSTTWKTLIDSGNYNSYSPTLTGTGASGTWGISISGNAATSDYVKYQHTNEINFKNVPSNLNGNIWFNYRNGDTDAVDTSDNEVTYKFGNYNAKTSKTTLDATSFTGNAATASTLKYNSTITYGAQGLQMYCTTDSENYGTPVNGTTITNPTDTYYYHLMLNYCNTSGYYLDIAAGLFSNGGNIYYRKVSGGTVYDWVKFLDSENYSSYALPRYNSNLTAGYIPKLSTTGQTDLANSIIFENSNGIGIGTTSPAYTLDVSGKIRTTNTIIAHKYNSANNLPAITLDKPGSYAIGIGADGTSNRIKFGPCVTLAGDAWVEQNTFNSNQWFFQGYIHATNGIDSESYVTALATNSSDKRLKKEIKPFNAKQIIDKLSPVEFEWNKKANKYNSNLELNKKNYGLIAQDSDGIIDNLVFDLPDGKGYKGVRYEKLIPILLQAVKEQQKEIDELKQIIKKLKV